MASLRLRALAVSAALGAAAAQAQELSLEEIVVTARPLERSPLEIAQPASVLVGDELRRSIATSLGETLARQPGVSSSYFGPAASRPVIRGLGGDRVLVLEDGISALDVSSLSQDHAVSLEAIAARQIEVIKGPTALLYGSGAAGGLVNVVSNRIPAQRAAAPISGAIELRGDTAADQRVGALALDGGRGTFAWHMDLFDRESRDVEVPRSAGTDGRIANSWSESGGGAAGAALVGETLSGGLAFSRYKTAYGIPGEEEAFIDLEQDRADLRAEWRLSRPMLDALRLRGSWVDYEHTEFEEPGEPGTVFAQRAHEARLTLDHRLGSAWTGTLGIQYRDLDFRAAGDEAFVPSSATRATSLFLLQERKAGPWTLELGARAEHQSVDADADGLPGYDELAASVSAGLVWRYAEDRAVALNLTRTQRHPQAVELYADGPHLAARRFELGDAGLREETAVTADLALRRSGESIGWNLNFFVSDYDRYIFPAPTGDIEDGLPVFAWTQADARFHGFEAELALPLYEGGRGRLRATLSADWVRGRLRDGGNVPLMPPLRVGAGLHFDRGDWHAGLRAWHHDRQDRVAVDELPSGGYTLVEADFSLRLPVGRGSLFAFLRGTNLLDEEARQATSPLKDVAPLPGRSLHAGLRFEF